jgi:ppGpp synthetase/RelA/SpoT-type nucleotidyltranferase
MVEDTEGLEKKFNALREKYEKLGNNLETALRLMISNKKIDFLNISYRIKNYESFIEKIERKKYKNPFEQVKDICGLRIICYYLSDIDKISKIINEEFDVLSSVSKKDKLEADRFGYLSDQFVVKIKDKWFEAPEWRGLNNLEAEIQVRTVSMHAWGEIEHKLAYKKKEHVPEMFRRKLYRLSALFEMADEQFENLRNERNNYMGSIKENYNELNISDIKGMNLDILQTFLDKFVPKKEKSIESTRNLLDELITNEIIVQDLYDSYQKTKEILNQIEREYFIETNKKFSQAGTIRCSLDITNKSLSRTYKFSEIEEKLVEKWRKKIK